MSVRKLIINEDQEKLTNAKIVTPIEYRNLPNTKLTNDTIHLIVNNKLMEYEDIINLSGQSAIYELNKSPFEYFWKFMVEGHMNGNLELAEDDESSGYEFDFGDNLSGNEIFCMYEERTGVYARGRSQRANK